MKIVTWRSVFANALFSRAFSWWILINLFMLIPCGYAVFKLQ